MATVAARQSRVALILLVVAVSSLTTSASAAKSFAIINNCSFTVWPGILSGDGPVSASAALDSTGFELAPGESRAMPMPTGWSGRLWGRTLCSTATRTGKFTCVTGDCGSGRQECAGGGPAPPATLAQFTLDGSGGMVSYGVSLVDGFNLPMLVAPYQQGAAAAGNCAPTGCVVDMNGACLPELRVITSGAGAVACRRACLAFRAPRYCCTGEYGRPGTCRPSAYSELFKKACPRAFSYANDGAGSTFNSHAPAAVTPSTPSFFAQAQGRADQGFHHHQPQLAATGGHGNLPKINGGTTPYTDVGSQVGAATAPWRIVLVVAVLGAVTAALGVLAKVMGLFKNCCNQTAAGAAV